jgi:Arginine repressor, DNA binding domain
VKPSYLLLRRPPKLLTADINAILEWLLHEGWRQQAEIMHWLAFKRGVLINQLTVSRMLQKQGWSRQVVYRISLTRSETLREGWRQDMRRFTADNLVFLDESIFNKKTGWRHQGWGPIGEEIRYEADVRRGPT